MMARIVAYMAAIASFVAAAIAGAGVAAAQGTPDAADRGPRFLVAMAGGQRIPVDATRAPILATRVVLNLEGVTRKQALAQIARQAGLQLVYGDALLRLDEPVRLRADGITVAAALTDVLWDAGLDVVFSTSRQAALVRRPAGAALPQGGAIVGRVTDGKTGSVLMGATVTVEGTSRSATTRSDGRYRVAELASGTYAVRARYIGYAPSTASVAVRADEEGVADFALEKSAQRLDEVVTTGTVVPTEVKALPTPISIVTAEDIQREQLQRVDQVFRGLLPGAIAWEQGPTAEYFSNVAIRGASTLSAVPSIKTFVDGVEMADPVFLATIDPNSIDRIEVTRGPQASTLYGTGALNGVMQIFTKKGEAGLRRPVVTAKLSVGATGGFEGQHTALQTDDAVSVFGGTGQSSYNLGGSYRRTGAWVPSYRSGSWGVAGGGQTTAGPLALSTSLRYADKTFDPSWDTRFQAYTYFSRPQYRTTRVRQQTYGVTGRLQLGANWQHTLTLGYDQTYLTDNQTQPRLTVPADSFLSVYASHRAMVSLLYHTDVTLRLGPSVSAVGAVGVNHEAKDYFDSFVDGATTTVGVLDGTAFTLRTPWSNTGYFTQLQVNLAERLFLTGGLRAERNTNFGESFGTAWSPRAGAAYVQQLGAASVKLRASYGESIRAPDPGQREASVSAFAITLANPRLAPERQRGVDGGIELSLGTASLGVTYYNQRAVDLIDAPRILSAPGPVPTFQYQNVGRVKNEGWEFEGRVAVGPVGLSGTYSITTSTVQQVAPGYTGDYQASDRLLGIPHRVAGVRIVVSPDSRTTLNASMTNIAEWTNLDMIAVNAFLYGTAPFRGSFRDYWSSYPSVTKFAVGARRRLAEGVDAFVVAENVADTRRFEQDNSFIPVPRTVRVGADLKY